MLCVGYFENLTEPAYFCMMLRIKKVLTRSWVSVLFQSRVFVYSSSRIKVQCVSMKQSVLTFPCTEAAGVLGVENMGQTAILKRARG